VGKKVSKCFVFQTFLRIFSFEEIGKKTISEIWGLAY